MALVTGASRGLGYAVAQDLARRGAHVIATARTQGGLEELDDAIRAEDGSATLVPMDLSQPDGIEKLAEAVSERWKKLDILVSNAGQLGLITPAAQIPAKVWNETMGINLIAPARLIRAFEGLLKQSDAGRAVFVSSSSARSRRAYWAAYAASKSALDALVQSWARELADSPLKVNLVDPGAMRTAMRAKAMPGEDPMSNPAPEDIAPRIADLCAPSETRCGEIIELGA